MLFEDTQKFGLNAGRQCGHFVEHDGAVARHFQASGLARFRAGERAALMAEELGFDKLRGKAGAIDFQECGVAAGALLMDPARQMILSRAAFAGDENGGRGAGDLACNFQHALRRGVSRDPFQTGGGHNAAPEACEGPGSGTSKRFAERHKRSMS